MPNPPMGANALPEYYPATGEVLTLKITKFGLLNRKDDVLEGGRRANNRKWKPWSVILTGSQLLLFRDPAWATTLLVKPETPNGQLLFPQTSLFKPDELLSVKDSIALYDKSYSKVLVDELVYIPLAHIVPVPQHTAIYLFRWETIPLADFGRNRAK